jgi:MFS family permease
LAGFSGGLLGLTASLAMAGAGGSPQHPLASGAVSRAYGERSRGPLGTYNFAGDLGKAALPPLVSLLMSVMHWRATLWAVAALGLLVALSIRLFMPRVEAPTRQARAVTRTGEEKKNKVGFALLFMIGVLDTATRMRFLLFLPFLMKTKGASVTIIGLALSLVFIGGAFGKAACGWLGERLGLLATVLTTEIATAIAILSLLILPLGPDMILLPFLGVMLNGTSSVLYGTVPELVAPHRIERAFAIFYTGILGSSARWRLFSTVVWVTRPASSGPPSPLLLRRSLLCRSCCNLPRDSRASRIWLNEQAPLVPEQLRARYLGCSLQVCLITRFMYGLSVAALGSGSSVYLVKDGSVGRLLFAALFRRSERAGRSRLGYTSGAR